MQCPEVVDHIGVESSVEVEKPDNIAAAAANHNHNTIRLTNDPRRQRRRDAAEKAYPPPITCLARTENHMPWVMRRYYSGDGRLVIREEKVKRHDYFHAHRSDGRLLLNLVPLDDAVQEEVNHVALVADKDDIKGAGDDEGVSRDPTAERCYRMGVKNPACGGFVATSYLAAQMSHPPILSINP